MQMVKNFINSLSANFEFKSQRHLFLFSARITMPKAPSGGGMCISVWTRLNAPPPQPRPFLVRLLLLSLSCNHLSYFSVLPKRQSWRGTDEEQWRSMDGGLGTTWAPSPFGSKYAGNLVGVSRPQLKLTPQKRTFDASKMLAAKMQKNSRVKAE